MRRRDRAAWRWYRLRFAAVTVGFLMLQLTAMLPLFTLDAARPWMIEAALAAAALAAAGNLFFGTKLGHATATVEQRRAEARR